MTTRLRQTRTVLVCDSGDFECKRSASSDLVMLIFVAHLLNSASMQVSMSISLRLP